MCALAGGEVQRNVSTVVSTPVLGAKAQNAGGEDLADLGKAFGGGHEVGVEGVVQGPVVLGEATVTAGGNHFRDDEDRHTKTVITMISDC